MTEKIRRSLERIREENRQLGEKIDRRLKEEGVEYKIEKRDGLVHMECIGPKRTPKRKKNVLHLTADDLLLWHIACAQYNENGKFCLSCDEVDIDNYSTNYIQIVWDEDGKEREYWSDDALYIEGHSFHMIDGPRVFHSAIPQYDFYYDTTVDEAAWQRLKTVLQDRGGKHLQLLQEMSEWVGNGFEDHKSFTMIAN